MVMPTYNRAGGYLEQAIESILEQDYANLELTVLDDGSTDETPQVLEGYAAAHPERFNWTRHDNMGQIRTIVKGFAMADGELVGYLNSDDLLLPQRNDQVGGRRSRKEGPMCWPPTASWYSIDEHGDVVDTVHALSPSELRRRSASQRPDDRPRVPWCAAGALEAAGPPDPEPSPTAGTSTSGCGSPTSACIASRATSRCRSSGGTAARRDAPCRARSWAR